MSYHSTVRRGTRSCSTFFFIASNKTTGLMVTQHTPTHPPTLDFGCFWDFGRRILVNVFLFPRISLCMHILIDGCYWKYPPPHYRIPYHLSSHLHLTRRTLSIPATSHILFRATYNHPGSFYSATCPPPPHAWYPRSYAGLHCVDVPRNLFF